MNNNLYMSSLLKAFDVLDCFQDDKQELGISDIAVLVGMPVSSVHRLIQSLEYEGMLIQNRENKKYSLGSKLMAMSVKCRTSRSFGRIASKYVDQLGQLTGETVNLSTCSGDRIINVYHAESHFVLRPNFPLYTSYPAYKTSVGRVFLSWMGDPALKWIYENNKDDISMTQEEFLAMLHQARARRLRARRSGVQRGSAMRGGPRFPHRQQADVCHLHLRAAVADGRCALCPFPRAGY